MFTYSKPADEVLMPNLLLFARQLNLEANSNLF